MKKIILFLIGAIAFSGSALAQVPNGGGPNVPTPSGISISGTFNAGDIAVGKTGPTLGDSLFFGTNGGISLTGGGTPAYNNCFYSDHDSCTTENIRLRERSFFGKAVLMTDNLSGCCTALGYPSTAPLYLLLTAQLASVSDRGAVGMTGACKISDQPDNIAPCIGVGGFAINDSQVTGLTGNFAYASYFECTHAAATTATACYGTEIDPVNYTANQSGDSYSVNGGSFGIWLAAGGGHTPTYPSNAAIVIVANTQTFNEGIVIRQDGLTVDGSGNSIAMALPQGATINWGVSSGVVGFSLRSKVATAGANITMQVLDNQVQFLRAGGGGLVVLTHVTNGVNGVGLQDGATGVPSVVSSFGSDSVVGLDLVSKSTGSVRIYPGTDTAGAFKVTNNAKSTTYLSIDTSAGQVSLPAVPTGTPVASLCLDGSGNIIKKTTAGSCI